MALGDFRARCLAALRRRARPLTTVTFRLAFLGGLLFSLTSIGLLEVVRWATLSLLDQRLNAAVDADRQWFQAMFRQGGLAALTAEVAARIESRPGRQRIYLLVDDAGRPVLGNIDVWPSVRRLDAEHFEFNPPALPDELENPARGGVVDLGRQGRLLVARVETERAAFRQVIARTMVGGGIIGLCLGVLLGLIMARHALGRLDAINRLTAATLRGNLAARVALSGSGDEFDQLAGNLNGMMNRIDRLVSAMRGVTRNIAHDLRTPLNRLRTRLESALIGEDLGDAGRAEATLVLAIEDIDNVLATFSAILGIARVEGMAARQGFSQVSMTKLIADAVDLYSPLAEEQGSSLTTEAADRVPAVDGDPQLIFQALVNLIDNALKYGRPGNQVVVSLGRVRDEVRLAVADRGPGIPADQREAVLQPFVRLDASRHTPGIGLGLSLVAAVAEFHQARLELADHQPGLQVVLGFPIAQD